MRKKRGGVSGDLIEVSAGNFSEWLRGTEASLRSGKRGSEVPCGACRGCCRSSMFIHIKPEETQTMARIPNALLFPAPGLPKGHVLMGYSDQGHCPMLVDGDCSIYEFRPQTCRDYDCRVFAATRIAVEESQTEIANRVRAWRFDYESDGDRERHRLVREAAAFLQENRDLFPQGSLPSYPVQLAALAVRIYRVFSGMIEGKRAGTSAPPDAVIAQAILSELRENGATFP